MAACPQDPGLNLDTALSLTNPLCSVSTAGKLSFGGIWQSYVDDVSKALTEFFKVMATLFLEIPDPDLGDASGNLSDTVSFLKLSVGWYVGIFFALSIAISGLRIMYSRQAKDLADLARIFGRVIVANFMYVPFVVLILEAGDQFSSWVIETSTEGRLGFGEQMASLFLTGESLVSGLLTIIGMLLVCLLSLFLCVLMIVRGAVLILLVGTITVPAALSGLEMGQDWWRRQIGWITGWLLFKPAAALIYGAGFRLISPSTTATTGEGILAFIYGFALLLLAAWTLPSIVKLVAPAAGASGGNGGGASVLAGVAAAVGVGKFAKTAAAAGAAR